MWVVGLRKKRVGYMVNIKRAALEIKTIGLYDGILQDILKKVGVDNMDERGIGHFLVDNPAVLAEYKMLNTEYNISNIHIKDVALAKQHDTISARKIELLNSNLSFLRENEKYTLDFAQSSTLLTVMSIEFFVLFSAQYFIVLLDMKNWQLEIYTLFLASIAWAYWYSKKQKALYVRKKEEFETRYEEALLILSELEDGGVVKKDDLWISEYDGHI